MSDPAGQLPNRLHFLGLSSLLLCRNLLRQIPNEGVEHVAIVTAKCSHAHLDPDLPTIPPLRLDLEAFSQDRASTGPEETGDSVLMSRTMGLRHDLLGDCFSDCLRAGPSEHRLALRVPCQH